MRNEMRGVPLLTHPDKGRRSLRWGGAVAARAPAPTEQQWHIALVATIRKAQLLSPGWRMTHFPAGEKRPGRAGAVVQAMGLERGWPDLLFARPCTPDLPVALMHGLELKRAGREQTEEQVIIGEWFLANRWPYVVVDQIDDAWRILWDWGALRRRVHS